jgi:Zn finger protein HypA/HybF involved in hydrogenase expression
MKRWWCMNCDQEVQLGKHGQCEVCGSEAVDMLPMDSDLEPSCRAAGEESEAVPARH